MTDVAQAFVPGHVTGFFTIDQDPDPTPGTGELAPGLDADGIADAARLVDAHTAALAGTSYTARLSTTRAAPNGTERERYDRVVRVESRDRFRYVLTSETADLERRIDRWRGGDRAYAARVRGGVRGYLVRARELVGG